MNINILSENPSIRLARNYAKEAGLRNSFLCAYKRISSYPSKKIVITARKNNQPSPCIRITIANKDKGKILSGVDYTVPFQENIGEVVFKVMREFSDKYSELYKKVFKK